MDDDTGSRGQPLLWRDLVVALFAVAFLAIAVWPALRSMVEL